jgi:photosystem II stability/assembly factor-like uncharacterized protein
MRYPPAMRLAALLLLIAATTAHSEAQWEIEDSHTTASLRGIYNVGGGVVWASGTGGTVLRTTDDGKTWQTCPIPLAGTKDTAEKLDFRGIQAFDEKTAIVMSSGPGDLSRLYKTTDGCQTWKLLFTNPDKDGFWDAIFFDGREIGWLLGDPTEGSFTLFETFDSGVHWFKQHNLALRAQSDTQGAFAASNSSLYEKNGLVVFGTGGKLGAFAYLQSKAVMCLDYCSPSDPNFNGTNNTWVRPVLPVGQKTDTSGVFSIGAQSSVVNGPLGAHKLVAVGGDYKQPDSNEAISASSLDGGKTWKPAKTPPHGYRSAVAYDSATKTWITVGPNGTDISTDDGRNWRALVPTPLDEKDADKNWNALSLPFVVGPKGRIGKLRPTAILPTVLPPTTGSKVAKP